MSNENLMIDLKYYLCNSLHDYNSLQAEKTFNFLFFSAPVQDLEESVLKWVRVHLRENSVVNYVHNCMINTVKC